MMAGSDAEKDSPLAIVSSVIAILTFLVSLSIAAYARTDHWQAIERDFHDFEDHYWRQTPLTLLQLQALIDA